jgi:transposase
MKKVPKDTKKNILNRLIHGVSIRKVAEEYGISRGAVGNIRKDHEHLIQMNKGGRPKCLTSEQERSAVRYVTQGDIDNESLQRKHVKETVKHSGGNIKVWGSISDAGVGWLVRIEGNMNKELYLDILKDDLEKNIDLAAESMGQDRSKMFFQQDNDPKHSSKLVQKYLQTVDFTTLDHPPQSPDLNPIEHMWALVKRRLNEYDTPPRGINELYDRVYEVWYNKITIQEVHNVINSMRHRLEAVIKAKGFWTKY